MFSPADTNSRDIGEFKKEYPEAKLVAVDEAVKKKAKEGLEFHGGASIGSKQLRVCSRRPVWGTDPRDRQFGFESDVRPPDPILTQRSSA